MAKKMVLKFIKIEIEKGRIKPTLSKDRKLVGFYLRRLRGTVAKKYFSEDAWDYACKYFGVEESK